jgi:hypothetical protein
LTAAAFGCKVCFAPASLRCNQIGQAPPDDLPRLFDQPVNDLAGRLDLADQPNPLPRQQTHRIDLAARIDIGR